MKIGVICLCSHCIRCTNVLHGGMACACRTIHFFFFVNVSSTKNKKFPHYFLLSSRNNRTSNLSTSTKLTSAGYRCCFRSLSVVGCRWRRRRRRRCNAGCIPQTRNFDSTSSWADNILNYLILLLCGTVPPSNCSVPSSPPFYFIIFLSLFGGILHAHATAVPVSMSV